MFNASNENAMTMLASPTHGNDLRRRNCGLGQARPIFRLLRRFGSLQLLGQCHSDSGGDGGAGMTGRLNTS